MSGSENRAYDNVRDQIGFCGIWCGSCVVGNGTLRKLTEKYDETTTGYGLHGWAPKDFDYAEFSKGLKSIQQMPPCPGCLQGGGRDDCEIRACASQRELSDCALCDEFGGCQNRGIVDTMRSGAVAAGLFVKDPGADGQVMIQEWEPQLKRRWPCAVLFLEGG